MLKALVFDFDGVIVDSEPLHYQAFLMVAKGLGVDFDYDHYLQAFIGFDDRDAFRAILAMAGDSHATGSDASEARVADLCRQKQEVFDRLAGASTVAIPGVLALIDQARSQVPIAICSGATRRDIELMLSGLGYRDRFEIIVTADDVAHSKPDPSCYQLAVEKLAARYPDRPLTAGQCLAIEDTAAGLAAARGAGLMTLGITTTSQAAALHAATRVHASERGLEGVDFQQLQAWFG